MKHSIAFLWLFSLILAGYTASSQHIIRGTVMDASQHEALPGANVQVAGASQTGTVAGADGSFQLTLPPEGARKLVVSYMGYRTETVTLQAGQDVYPISLHEDASQLDAVMVVSGSLKEVSKLESPVPIEVYTPTFFKKNPAPNLFESMSNINGVRPQVNCNVCNTGDIRINGLDGPYTMVLIDGMPIVSGLSTVYGLSGIPASLIERVEIVKGPASTLYGSEAVAGLINIITQTPEHAPHVSVDVMSTTWAEVNTDVGVKFQVMPRVHSLLGVNYYHYENPIDHNDDGFTDVTQQNRISVFDKISLTRRHDRTATLSGRYMYEDRWGGQMDWTPTFRGTDSLYGESIYTRRWEVLGAYQLPMSDRVMFNLSANGHDQDSYYGTTAYMAQQKVLFGQLTWNKMLGHHDVLGGMALRYTWYDDNTPATASGNGDANAPSVIWLPGLFIQDEITLTDRQRLLLGLRYDHNSIHGNIFTPRVNYKWTSANTHDVIRVSAGNGYRVANVFTEDHAALTGARTVVFQEDLKPETSWHVNIHYVKTFITEKGFIDLDATAFYTHFGNKIVPDYTTHANEIIYSNLNGHGVSQGVSLNLDYTFMNGAKILAGATVMDVYNVTKDQGQSVKARQLFTERYTGVWTISYPLSSRLTVDYTGNLYGPMKLPLLSDLDPRDEMSPVWSIQNIQFTYEFNHTWTVYGGVKNLLNYTPAKNSIARAHDPFDKAVTFDTEGNAVATENNPHALTFDPTYVYAPNQGIRGFVGLRYLLDK